MSPKKSDIGPLEMEILGIVDSHSEPLSVGGVKERLKGSSRDLAYTTVMTVLVRLYGKGLVQRRQEGRQFLYSTGRGAVSIKKSMLERLTTSFFQNDKLKPIMALLEDDRDLSAEELRELRGMIDKKIKEAEKKA